MLRVAMNTLLESPTAPSEVEVAGLDLRYAGCRLRQPAREERLLLSMAERGIEQPLEGIAGADAIILLDGFKRHRCACKLHLGTVPLVVVGADAAAGIIGLLRGERERRLSLLEQAAFLDELQQLENLSVAELAAQLARSKSWVSVRLGLLAELSPAVRAELFSGRFPVYAYLSTLRPFMRKNRRSAEVEQFVLAVSGRGLSVREISGVARAFFTGGEAVQRELLQGHVKVLLAANQKESSGGAECDAFEQSVLHDLATTQKCMVRVVSRCDDPRLRSGAFHAQSQVLTQGMIDRGPGFLAAVRRLHDRAGQT